MVFKDFLLYQMDEVATSAEAYRNVRGALWHVVLQFAIRTFFIWGACSCAYPNTNPTPGRRCGAPSRVRDSHNVVNAFAVNVNDVAGSYLDIRT